MTLLTRDSFLARHSTPQKFKLDRATLLAIEDAVNYPKFAGYRVGVMLNDVLTVAFFDARKTWNWETRLADKILQFLQRWHQGQSGRSALGSLKGRILITWLFDRDDLRALMIPIAEKIGLSKTLVLVANKAMQSKLPAQTACLPWHEFPAINMQAWRQEYDRCAGIWRMRLEKLLEQHALPSYIATHLLQKLQVQTQRLMSADILIAAVHPKAIVTEYDRNSHASCLMLSAERHGIPTITMLHAAALGTYPAYAFAPVLARFVCCWGDQHYANLLAHGVLPERLVVTGCQALEHGTPKEDRKAVSAKLGLDSRRAVLMLATSPIAIESRLAYTRMFCQAASLMEGVQALVRLHPAERRDEYQTLINAFPNIRFLENCALSRDESLAVCDIVITHESSFGFDALIKGKPLALIDLHEAPLIHCRELIEVAECPIADNVDALVSVLLRLLTDSGWRKLKKTAADAYVETFCKHYGAEALSHVCQVIDEAGYSTPASSERAD